MRFRTAIILAISLLLAIALTATASVVSLVLDRAARRELQSDLSRGRAVFEDLWRYRVSLHRAESRILADEPRLKAVVSTDDVTRATVVGVISDLRRALRSDLLLLTDRGGHLIADATHLEDKGDPLGDNPTIATTLETGEAEGVWRDGAQLYQVHGRRLSYGALTVGAVVVGYRVDDALADAVERQLEAGVSITSGAQLIAGSKQVQSPDFDRAALASIIAALPPEVTLREVTLHGARYLLTTAPLPGYGEARYAVFRSLDAALAPARSLMRMLYGITAIALLLALILAVRLSRRLSQPVDDLVAFTQRIGAGVLQPIVPRGLREIRTLGAAMNQMADEISTSRAQAAEKTRIARELEIANRIQTALLPHDFALPGLQVEAQMVPASEVGGDYYDLIAVPGGCWIGVGDVAGHGLPAGMVMFMVQSIFATLARSHEQATPTQLVVLLNKLLYDNVRNRLHSDEHVTFMAARYFHDGRVLFAGAHETIIILRKATGRCELVETPGTWLGIIEDISHATQDSTLLLCPGDVMVLYSDGVTEAMNERQEQLGLSRLCEAIEGCAGLTVHDMHTQLLDRVRAFSKMPQDDITLLVLRHEGIHGT